MPILELYDPRRREPYVHIKSGANWGFANAHVCQDDAYIALRKDFLRNNPGFFPSHGCCIDVVWDDGTVMCCLLEGTQDVDGVVAPKQISTFNDKSILGVYLRDRLNVESNHVITYQDLQKYGRDDIEVCRLEDGRYYFDFSV